jgi:hypothetical protein
MRGQTTTRTTGHLPRTVLGMLLALACGLAVAQNAGRVEFARGVGFAQSPGQMPRTLGKGLELREGDRLTTSEGGSAVIQLEDGTRMTVRPNSELVLQQYQFKQDAQDNSMVLQMVRGGFRAITGLISKNSPNAAKVQTGTATIGIRGTDFDARLCAADCASESARIREGTRPNAILASAKIVQSQGEVFAVDANGQRRRVVDGGSIYPGDVVETSGNGQAALAFRDDTKITLGAGSRFRVDNFVYDEQNAREGRFLASVLRGTVRALTGLIAKANNRNVGFSTATATIGVRGTGFDVTCTGACAGEPGGGGDSGLTVFTTLGSIAVTPQGQTALQVLQAGQGLFISPTGGILPINTPPIMNVPPPNFAVPPKLFATQEVPESKEGLHVLVREGHIEVATETEVLHLGKGEAGYAGPDGQTARPADVGKFLLYDRMPIPRGNEGLILLLDDGVLRVARTCS